MLTDERTNEQTNEQTNNFIYDAGLFSLKQANWGHQVNEFYEPKQQEPKRNEI